MKTIQVSKRAILDTGHVMRLTHYMAHVIESGHIPGVLSGAELVGNAKRHAGSYRNTRDNVARALRDVVGVTSDLVLTRRRRSADSRWCRVWVDCDGNPVRLELTK